VVLLKEICWVNLTRLQFAQALVGTPERRVLYQSLIVVLHSVNLISLLLLRVGKQVQTRRSVRNISHIFLVLESHQNSLSLLHLPELDAGESKLIAAPF
jgi:hypothetical protein